MCSLKCQNETAEIDKTRRAKTILRSTPRYSHDSFGHCESDIREVEKQMHVMIYHMLAADHKCDSDRHAAWTITHYTVKADEQNRGKKLIVLES